MEKRRNVNGRMKANMEEMDVAISDQTRSLSCAVNSKKLAENGLQRNAINNDLTLTRETAGIKKDFVAEPISSYVITGSSDQESTLPIGKGFPNYDLPELVVFLREDSATPEIAKDLCEGMEVSSAVNVKLAQESISSLMKPDLQCSSGLAEELLKKLSSDSSDQNIKHVIGRSKLGIMFIEDDKDIKSTYETSTNQSVRNRGHSLKEFLSDKGDCGSYMPSTSTEASSKSCNTRKAGLQVELGSRKDCPECAGCQQPPEILTMSKSENLSSECITNSSKHFEIHHGDQAESTSLPGSQPSNSVMKFGCASHRSNGSTGSTNSFAFPILTSDWNGSPARMAETEGSKLEKHRSWRACFVCCKF